MNRPPANHKILVLAALESELPSAALPPHVHCVYTGVGKINAAVRATIAILEHKPDLVVNYGTAGKVNVELHGLLEIAEVLQRDMLTLPLAPRGVTPFSERPHLFSSGFAGAVCGTGDSFVTASDPWLIENRVDLVDMELFAIAHVCDLLSTPWRAFKYITDAADESSGTDWVENVHRGNELFLEKLDKEIWPR